MDNKKIDDIKDTLHQLQCAHTALLKVFLETYPEDQRKAVLEKYAGHKVTALSADLLHWVTDYTAKSRSLPGDRSSAPRQ